jgi:hypothetical protein
MEEVGCRLKPLQPLWYRYRGQHLVRAACGYIYELLLTLFLACSFCALLSLT